MRQLSLLSDGEETTIKGDLDAIIGYCKGVIGVCQIAQRDLKTRQVSTIPLAALLQIVNDAAKSITCYSDHITEQYHAISEYLRYDCQEVAKLSDRLMYSRINAIADKLCYPDSVDHGEPVYDTSDLITKAEV